MKQHDNDNSNPWTSIGLQAALILNRLRLQAQLTQTNEKKDEQSEHQPNTSDGAGNRIADRRALV